MPFDFFIQRSVYDKTDGCCHICRERISISNYGLIGRRGAWEIDHSKPKSRGGTDHLNNLLPACIPCNRDKSNSTTRTARRWNGYTRAPYSKAQKAAIKEENATAGAIIGGVIGIVGGPPGMLIGASIGALFGGEIKPPEGR